MKSGVYRIVNLKTGRMYIGSSIDLKVRKINHFSMLKNNKHSSIILQRAYNKAENKNIFEFQILEYCNKSKLIERENFYLINFCKAKEYIDKINKEFLKLSYNILPIASEGFSGRHRIETIQKMKENHPLRKDILIYKDSLFIKEVLSAKDAELITGLSKNGILEACKNKRYITKSGYMFCFKEDIKDLENNLNLKWKPWNKDKKGTKNLKNATKVEVKNLKTQLTEIFESQLSVCKLYNLQPCTINRCLKSGKPYKKYLQFKYHMI
jgi:group I intron endonuclease